MTGDKKKYAEAAKKILLQMIGMLKRRVELPPVLIALQYIFVTPALNEKVFDLLEKKISPG